MSDQKKSSYTIPGMTVRLFKIAAPAKKLLIVSTLSSVIGNVSQMGLAAFGALAILSTFGMTGSSAALWLALAVVCGILITVCRYIEGVISHRASYSLLAAMRIHFFHVLRELAPACLLDRKKGDLLNMAVSDIEALEFFFAHTIGPMVTIIVLPVITLVFALTVHPMMALILLPIYLVISVLFPTIAMKAGRGIGMNYRTSLGGMKSLILESVYGLKDIQIFDEGEERLNMVKEQNRKINRAAHGLTLHRQTVSSAPTFFIYLARIAIAGLASWLGIQAGGNVPGVIVLSFVATSSFSSTQSITMVISSLLEAYAAAERLFTIEDTEPEIQEAANPKRLNKIETIEFKHVDFWYNDPSKILLKDFNLKLSGHDHLGIVGESGIGKSTVLRLLMRFWDPKGGQILINDIPLTEYSLADLRRRIAVLEQDTFLFNDSIAANIAIGRPEASMDEIKEAARRAGIHDFISTLPEGYATQMGEMGSRLSGGERQRVGIARIMLLDPDVIVMDEPTSALDVLHEKELLKTLQEISSDKMQMIVSHRDSTLIGCERILRLERPKA